jgi:Mor family transcriptional regulator
MNEVEDEFSIGSLLIYRDITEEQKNLFIDFLSTDISSCFKVLFNIIDDDFLVMELLDVFAGKKIQFPDRKKLYKLLEKVKIYSYVKSKNYSPESYKLLAKQYKKRISQIRSTVERVDSLIKNKNIESKEE